MLFAEMGFGFCTSEEGSSTALCVHCPEALYSEWLTDESISKMD